MDDLEKRLALLEEQMKWVLEKHRPVVHRNFEQLFAFADATRERLEPPVGNEKYNEALRKQREGRKQHDG